MISSKQASNLVEISLAQEFTKLIWHLQPQRERRYYADDALIRKRRPESHRRSWASVVIDAIRNTLHKAHRDGPRVSHTSRARTADTLLATRRPGSRPHQQILGSSGRTKEQLGTQLPVQRIREGPFIPRRRCQPAPLLLYPFHVQHGPVFLVQELTHAQRAGAGCRAV